MRLSKDPKHVHYRLMKEKGLLPEDNKNKIQKTINNNWPGIILLLIVLSFLLAIGQKITEHYLIPLYNNINPSSAHQKAELIKNGMNMDEVIRVIGQSSCDFQHPSNDIYWYKWWYYSDGSELFIDFYNKTFISLPWNLRARDYESSDYNVDEIKIYRNYEHKNYSWQPC